MSIVPVCLSFYHLAIDISVKNDIQLTPLEMMTTPFRAALQMYGDQEARCQAAAIHMDRVADDTNAAMMSVS
jgi:hypothetical protein